MRSFKNLSRSEQARLSSGDPVVVDHVEDAVIISESENPAHVAAARLRSSERVDGWRAQYLVGNADGNGWRGTVFENGEVRLPNGQRGRLVGGNIEDLLGRHLFGL